MLVGMKCRPCIQPLLISVQSIFVASVDDVVKTTASAFRVNVESYRNNSIQSPSSVCARPLCLTGLTAWETVA